MNMNISIANYSRGMGCGLKHKDYFNLVLEILCNISEDSLYANTNINFDRKMTGKSRII